MNEIITARDPEIIAAEINTIKAKVRQAVIYSSIEIGGKLVEVKSLVPHGEWGKWLEQNVEYSQSTADYLMRLYQEYGTGQENLFDTWTNSQTFAKLTYSQHIALLALPFGERQEFAEQNHVEDMSTRQLQQAIRERDEAVQAQAEAEQRAADAEQKAEEAEQRAVSAEQKAAERNKKADDDNKVVLNAMKSRAEVAEQAKVRAEKSEQNALNLVKKLEKQLSDAQAAEKAAAEELKKAQENPTVPEAVMEQMRAEVAADAAKQASADAEKLLAAAKKEAEEANRAREAAEAALREAEEKILAAQKETRLSNPKVVVFKTLFDQIRQNVDQLTAAYKEILKDDPDAAKNCRKAYNALLDSMDTALD